MKITRFNTVKSLVAATAALGLIAVPVVQADDDQTTVTVETREALSPEVTSTFVEDYTIPTQYRTYFTEVPTVEEENVVVRYAYGRAYYVNSDDWKIVRVVELDPTVEVSSEAAVFVEGYVIPETYRTRLVEVPTPEPEVRVRYYNNTAYYVDSSYRIVRAVPLRP